MKYSVRDESGLRPVAKLRHPAWAWGGFRPAAGQHTRREHAALQRWAGGRSTLVEIGVAEGVSARALREGMAAEACLYLIDPFHLSRIPMLNFMKRVARRTVKSCRRGRVVWIQNFSHQAVFDWKRSIDLLFIDGDHAEIAVEQDWRDWSPFLRPGGVALLHDARLFEGGWTTGEYGPVRFANRLFRDGQSDGWRIAEEVDSLLVLEKL